MSLTVLGWSLKFLKNFHIRKIFRIFRKHECGFKKKITAEEVIFYLGTKELKKTWDYVEGLLGHDSTPTYTCISI